MPSGSNNFQQWNPNQANQETDGEYLLDTLRVNGAVSGLFPSITANKLFYQSSIQTNLLDCRINHLLHKPLVRRLFLDNQNDLQICLEEMDQKIQFYQNLLHVKILLKEVVCEDNILVHFVYTVDITRLLRILEQTIYWFFF